MKVTSIWRVDQISKNHSIIISKLSINCQMKTYRKRKSYLRLISYLKFMYFDLTSQYFINIQMSQENGIVITNQEAVTNPPSQVIATNSPDDIPIGGSKFNFSEYPSENDAPPPPKKTVARKPLKGSKKEEIPNENKEEISTKSAQPLDQIQVGGNNCNANNFDDKPIAKGNFTLSQFPEGEAPAVVQTVYTMTQMLKSKANKLKLSGLEALLKMLEQDPNNSQISQVSMPALLKETVPANLQKSLQCMVAWMKNGRSWGQDEARNTIQNGYINGKANSKKQSVQIIDLMYEEKPETVEMTLLLGFKSKTAKNIAGYNAMLNELIAIYGVKRLKYLKPYLGQVLRVIGTQKLPAVKTEGMNTLKQAYKWMTREVVQPMLKDIKEAQKKQLDTFWEGYDKTIVMAAPKNIPDEVGGKNKGKKVDAYDLSQPVDVFKKFNEKWSDNVINAPKWNQKTKLMEDFVKEASVPKLANTDFRPATEVIRRLINDSNFNVVLWVLKMIGVMSKGLRRPFGPTAKSNFSNIIAKFRDKKTQMIDQTFKCLSDLNYCLAIEEVLEDVKEGLADKAPNMRINMINWIGKYVEQKAEEKGGQVPEKTREAIKQLLPLFQKLLNEGVAEVRENAAKCIGKLQMFFDQDFFNVIKGKMNKNLASKIVTEPKNQSTKPSKQTNKKTEDLSKSQLSTSKPPQPAKDGSKIKPAQKEKQKQKQKQQIKQLQSFDEPAYQTSLQSLIGLGYPQQQIKKITSSSANDRGTILAYFRDNPYQNFNDVLRVIRKAYKDWKQVNLNMNKDLIAYFEERQTDIGKPEAYVIIPYIIQKVGDSKFAEPLTRLVIHMCKSIPPRFIVGHIIRYVKSTEGKKPKLNSDTCVLLVKIIQAVSLSNLNSKELIDFAKDAYAVQFSKKGGAELLVCIYTYIGQNIKTSLDEATSKGMQNEFKANKVLTEDQKKATIQFEGQAALQCKVAPIKKAESKNEGKLRDLSNDIIRLLPSMNDNGNWQKRKEAAEALSSLLQQGGRIAFGNTINDLLATLKIRINDPNKQLIKGFVHLAGQVLCALPEKQLKFNARNFIASLIQGFNDKNQLNRKQIHNALGKIADTLGKQAVLSTLGSSLEGDRQGRVQVLNLIMNLQDGIPKADIKDYAKGLTNCLCDKNKDVRSGAQKVFEKVYEKLGLQTFRSIAKNQKPAVEKDLNLFLDKFDRNNATTSSFNSKGTSPNKQTEKSNIREKQKQKSRLTMTQQNTQIQQQLAPPLSAKKRSLSRNNTQKSFIQGQEQPYAATVTGTFMASKRTMVQGNQIFANIKYLAAQRAQRQANQHDYCWRLDEIKENQQEHLRNQIEKLLCTDLSKKMLSFDYKRVYEGVFQIAKLIKNLSYDTQIRELYDILFKWILIRLWGGQPGMVSTIQLVAPILSVLEKKKLALTDFQVQLVIAIIRQYLISALMVGFKFSQSLYSILKCLVALSSGEKVLRKVLHQFSIELSAYHKHLRKDNVQFYQFYREALSKLIKNQLIDYVGNSDTLQEVSKIKELKQDPQFVSILYTRLHENVLSNFGFKRVTNNNNFQQNSSGVGLNNASFTSDRQVKDRSLQREKLPPKGDKTTNTMIQLRPSNLPTPAARKNPPIQSNIDKPIPSKIYGQESVKQSNSSPQNLQYIKNCYHTQILNISVFPAPHPASPLGKQLSKLVPPADATIAFFNTLFAQTSQKIVAQLTNHSKYIFGSILKSVYEIITARNQYPPDRIVAQITLLQNCIKCPHVIQNIGQLLGYGTSFALTQLVYEDQHKSQIVQELRSRNIEYKSDNFIKAINGVMLRLLQNANPQQIVNILIELLAIHSRSSSPSAKTISLIIKCLGRVASGFCKQIRLEAVKTFLAKSNEYLASIQYDTPLQHLNLAQRQQNREKIRNQDSAANSIKAIITQICKCINSEIWQVYQKAMMQSKFPDKHIASYLNSLNVRLPQRPRVRSQAKQNEELKKINELLSKTKSYEAGIIQLRKYSQKHPQFSPVQYFTSLNYDQKFIAMVVKSLQGTQRLTPAKDKDQNQENIQDKIQKLKRKFQQLQPEGQQNNNSSSVSRRPVGEQQQRQQRALQIKRRIEQMKNKMTSTINRK